MKGRHRITTIYRKELIDILRDHRTLIAMIVVPIVLYPLLMLGSVQAVSYQAENLSSETIKIGVVGDDQRLILTGLIAADAQALAEAAMAADAKSGGEPPAPLTDQLVAVFESREQLEEALHSRSIPVGVSFKTTQPGAFRERAIAGILAHGIQVELLADKEEPRGVSASRRLKAMFDRLNGQARAMRNYADPFQVESVDMSSPASVLGAVLPLILILMTITGAIYPAIDLTAGERERGTLESLMVCPVPVFDLIVGKFLVVTTVAVMGAALNLASVTATVYFGGFGELIAQEGGSLPLGTMLFILLALIPFAVFMSALMMAVCSYARTFKEAQNYVTPVILAVLIPGGIAAFPATRLDGVMLVMPVGNMVALAKELLLGSQVPLLHILIVLLSTSLYAAAAVGVAAAIFGKESVVFADSGSLRGTFARKHRLPAGRPSVTMGLMVSALLFPAWFFVQAMLSPGPGEDVQDLLWSSAWLMPTMFAGVPLLVMWYWRVRPASGLSLRLPGTRFVAAGVLIGLSAWVLAHELNVLQQRVLGTPHAVVENARMLSEALALMSPSAVLLLIAIIPAASEELLFRGFLLNALATTGRKWLAIIGSAAVFAVFHFFLFKFAVTFALGLIFGVLCWRSRSVAPAMLAHVLHNAVNVIPIIRPQWAGWFSQGDAETWSHLPAPIIVAGGVVLLIGLALTLGEKPGEGPVALAPVPRSA